MKEHSSWSNGTNSIQECLFNEGFTFDESDAHFVKGKVRISATEIPGFTPATFLTKAKQHKWLESEEPEEVQLYSWGDQFMIAGMDCSL